MPELITGAQFAARYAGRFAVAFTGTRKPTELTISRVDAFLRGIKETFKQSEIVVVQGGCIGVDQRALLQAADVHGFTVHTVLPSDRSRVCPEWRVWSTTYEEGGAYRARNQRVVDRARGGLLAAFPADEEGATNSRRSGTWQTVRMARAAGLFVAVRLPILNGLIYRVGRVPEPVYGTPAGGPG